MLKKKKMCLWFINKSDLKISDFIIYIFNLLLLKEQDRKMREQEERLERLERLVANMD